MAIGKRPVIVREKYTDRTYCIFLHGAFKVEYERDPRGRSKYCIQVMEDLIVKNLSKIQHETESNFTLAAPNFYDGFRDISTYLKTGKPPSADTIFLRYIDAFMQLKVPNFNAAFDEHEAIEATGMMMGEFLRDPSAAKNREQLALNVQSVLGVFKYDEVDTLRQHHGQTRIVAFIAGNNIDYILMLDFYINLVEKREPEGDEYLNLKYGFCIAGDEFSPVILRSFKEHKRHIGLLYTAGNLIDMSGGVFDEITYEVFTTDKSDQARNSPKSKYSGDPKMAKAFEIHYGPNLKRYLKKVSDINELAVVQKKIDILRMGLL